MSSLKDLASLIMVPSLYKDGELHTVKPLADEDIILHPDATGNHDGNDGTTDRSSSNFTFSRGSNLAATRVDVNGLIEKGRENLYTYSNNFGHSDWNVKAGTFTQGVADPDGGNNAWSWTATNTDPYLYQSGKSLNGVGALSIWVKGVGSTIGKNFELRVASAPYKNVVLTGEWQRVEHYNNTASGTSVGFEYGNPAVAGDVVHIYQAQYEVGLVATDYIETGASTAQAGILEDMPRLDYSGGASCPALLLEPQRTNIFPQSEYLGSGGWVISNGTLTTNYAISPEGVQNAAKINFTSGGEIVRTTSFTAGQEYTFSFYAKVESGTFDFTYGNMAYSLISGTATTEWQRFQVTQIVPVATRYPKIDATDTGDLLIYGMQVELGSYPTSYIPTYGSSVTRSVDSCLATSVSDVIGQSSGTLFVDFITPDTDSYFINAISDGTNNNKVQIEYNTTANTIKGIVRVSATTSVDITATGKAPDTRYKAAIAYAENDFVFYVNGVKIGTDTSGSIPPSMSRIDIGTQVGTFFGAGDVNQMVLFQTKLTDSELAALTTI